MVRSRLFLLTLIACAAGAATRRSAMAETVLLDFTSPHCGPCTEMEPVLQQLEAQGTKIERVDVSQDQRLAERFRVEVTPTYIVLIDGQEWARVTGVTTHATMVEMLQHSAELAAASASGGPTAAGPNAGAAAPSTFANPFASRAPQQETQGGEAIAPGSGTTRLAGRLRLR
jgi:thioredoxin-like negative regulator of GroEL